MPPPPIPNDTNGTEEDKKKLETPLAAMLPSKYENVDVRKIFPDFRHGQVGFLLIHVFSSKIQSV